MIWNVMIKGHALEFRDGYSSIIDPWTLDEYEKQGISLNIEKTNVPVTFVKVGNTVCLLTNSTLDDFKKEYESGNLNTFTDVQNWLLKNTKIIGLNVINDLIRVTRKAQLHDSLNECLRNYSDMKSFDMIDILNIIINEIK